MMFFENDQGSPPIADPAVIRRLMSTGANSSELIAALYETFVAEARASDFDKEAISKQAIGADPCAHFINSADGRGSEPSRIQLSPPGRGSASNQRQNPYASYADMVDSRTLTERARRIDPRTGTCLSAYWGEDFINLNGFPQRIVNRALCWFSPRLEDDLVPDWAMREAWPEHSAVWNDLLQDAFNRTPEPW
jgi:hypothetical protein